MLEPGRETIAESYAWPALVFKGKGYMQITIGENASPCEGAYLKPRFTR